MFQYILLCLSPATEKREAFPWLAVCMKSLRSIVSGPAQAELSVMVGRVILSHDLSASLQQSEQMNFLGCEIPCPYPSPKTWLALYTSATSSNISLNSFMVLRYTSVFPGKRLPLLWPLA